MKVYGEYKEGTKENNTLLGLKNISFKEKMQYFNSTTR